MAKRYYGSKLINEQKNKNCLLPEGFFTKDWGSVGSMTSREVTDLYTGVTENQKYDISKLNEINKKGGR